MDIQTVYSLRGRTKACWEELLSSCGLVPEEQPDSTVLIWDNGELIATGSRKSNLIKYLAVSADRQGEDLTASLLTELRKDAFSSGYDHLFLYTKPKNRIQFESLFFYPVASTGSVLLLENRKGGIKDFLSGLEVKEGETVGAAVMNCNPFTKGHRYLIEKAAEKCDRLYVFVLSEQSGPFPAADRLELVKKGVSDLENVTVYPSGPYLISSVTFPTYFLKDRDAADTVHCELDIEIFKNYYAEKFHITKRFIGEEPFSRMTDKYNECLKRILPEHGISVEVIKRLESDGRAISASEVRRLMDAGDECAIEKLVPKCTFDYLKRNNYIRRKP